MSATQMDWIISDDPRHSHRPLEALRVAAGLGSWGKVVGSIWLCGPAVLVLDTNAEDLPDQDSIEKYLEILEGTDWKICVNANNPYLKQIVGIEEDIEIIPDSEWRIRTDRPGCFAAL
jgi:hypothetical protein